MQAIDRAVTVFVTTAGAQCDTFVQCHESLDIRNITLQVICQFLHCRRAIELLPQAAHRAQAGVDVFDDVYRQTHRTRLVHDAALDVLANPPGRIGRKTKTAFRIEFLHGVDQTEVAFLDQIEKRQATVDVAARNLDDQPRLLSIMRWRAASSPRKARREYSFLLPP